MKKKTQHVVSVTCNSFALATPQTVQVQIKSSCLILQEHYKMDFENAIQSLEWPKKKALGILWVLNLSPPITTKVPYTNSLDPDETPSNSASHPDPSWFDTRTIFSQSLKDIEAV